MFTAFCGACGGVQGVEFAGDRVGEKTTTPRTSKRWWKFWK
jgi:hypothetical protein